MRKYLIETIEIYTDGSCRKYNVKDSTGVAGWGYAIVIGGELYRYETGILYDSTGNRGELYGIIKGLLAAEPLFCHNKRVIVYSDSAYAINGLNNWLPNSWLPNGWINSQKKPVLNRDLWEQLVPYVNRFGFTFQKVKGHDTNYWNNFVDEKVQSATFSAKQQGGIKNVE